MKTATTPIAIVKGEGAKLYDESGNVYIDAIASWWTNLHGHAHPHIAEAITQQAKQLEHVIFADFTHRPAVELAERLLDKMQFGQSKIFFEFGFGRIPQHLIQNISCAGGNDRVNG
jgi:adenosylmethionine-8-amino-7-oxononanoate aminotransferase